MGSVYRHFSSKAALRDAVAERWLSRISAPLEAVASEQGPAPERLRRWFDVLMQTKRKMMRDDPDQTLAERYGALGGVADGAEAAALAGRYLACTRRTYSNPLSRFAE